MSDREKFYAVIPARLGSRRLHRKNLALLRDKPLVQHSIEYAIKHLPPERVVISSDSDEILSIAEPFGIHRLQRPKELALDTSTTGDAVRHAAISVFREIKAEDGIFILQPTTPWRPDNVIDEFRSAFSKHSGKTLVSVSPCKKKLGTIRGDDFAPYNYAFEGGIETSRNLFFENGMLYLVSWGTLCEGRVFSDCVVPICIDDERVVDIDTEADLRNAELLLRMRL